MNIKKALGGQIGILKSAVIAILLAGSVFKSGAQSYAINAGQGSMQINLTGANAGISDWTVNGINELNYQWLYLSVDGGNLLSLDNIGLLSSSESTFAGNVTVNAVYSNSLVKVTVASTLKPGNPGQSIFSSNISVYNPTGGSNTYSLYQYSDFAIGNGLGNQSVQFAGTGAPYKVTQTTSDGFTLTGLLGAVSGGTGDSIGEIAGTFGGTDGGNQFGLENGDPAPTFNDSFLNAGLGNVDFAYEITGSLGPSQTGLSFIETQTVPEPSTLGLFCSGFFVFGLFYARKLAFLKNIVKRASL